MELALTIIICILVSLGFILIVKKLKFSIIIGLIFAGLILGSPPVESAILQPNIDFVLDLGYAGFLALMFMAGMEISWCMLYRERRDATMVASMSFVIPLLLGFAVFLAMGYSAIISLTVGVCLAITAQATNAMLLLELGKLKTRVGSLLMGAGIIDDILGLFMFAAISLWFTGNLESDEFVRTVAGILVFFAGISVHRFIGRDARSVSYLERFLLYILVPFFFIEIGTNFDYRSLSLAPVLVFVIIGIAIVGKISGSLLSQPFTGLSLKQHYLVGWGMNSRGAVEMAIAFLAFEAGILTVDLYSGLVIMALVTTLLFPFFVKRMIGREPDIMGEEKGVCWDESGGK